VENLDDLHAAEMVQVAARPEAEPFKPESGRQEL
jgi:hypothetical protein